MGPAVGELGGGRSGVRVEDAVQAGRRDLDEAVGELGGGRVGETEHGRVGDAVELLLDRGVDVGMAMAVDVAPQRRGAVDVAVAVDVDQVGSLGALDDDGILLHPSALLREGVPEVLVVELGDVPAHRERKLGPPAVGREHPCARKLRVFPTGNTERHRVGPYGGIQ